jgi:two-component system, OmpR family, response regulator
MEVRKILLIDDENDIRKVAALSLQRVGGFEVVTAADGEQGLETASSEKPDLIIVDMMMPGMDGLTFLECHKQTPMHGIPVIFMTAKTQPHEIDDYMRRGAVGVISKPFDPMRLPADVKNIISNIESEY